MTEKVQLVPADNVPPDNVSVVVPVILEPEPQTSFKLPEVDANPAMTVDKSNVKPTEVASLVALAE